MGRFPHRERDHCLDVARDNFTKAAAALTEARTSDVVAVAFLHGAVGLLRIAEADKKEEAFAIVLAGVRAVALEQAPAEVPQP